MALLKASRSAQWPLVATFKFDITDTFVDIAGVTKAFSAAAPVFDIINLPSGAIVVGGQMMVTTVSDDSSTATLAVGDSVTANRYMAATSIKSAASTAFTLTGYEPAGLNLRVTLANAGANATVGTVRINVLFILSGRANEVYPA